MPGCYCAAVWQARKQTNRIGGAVAARHPSLSFLSSLERHRNSWPCLPLQMLLFDRHCVGSFIRTIFFRIFLFLYQGSSYTLYSFACQSVGLRVNYL